MRVYRISYDFMGFQTSIPQKLQLSSPPVSVAKTPALSSGLGEARRGREAGRRPWDRRGRAADEEHSQHLWCPGFGWRKIYEKYRKI